MREDWRVETRPIHIPSAGHLSVAAALAAVEVAEEELVGSVIPFSHLLITVSESHLHIINSRTRIKPEEPRPPSRVSAQAPCTRYVPFIVALSIVGIVIIIIVITIIITTTPILAEAKREGRLLLYTGDWFAWMDPNDQLSQLHTIFSVRILFARYSSGRGRTLATEYSLGRIKKGRTNWSDSYIERG